MLPGIFPPFVIGLLSGTALIATTVVHFAAMTPLQLFDLRRGRTPFPRFFMNAHF